MSEGMIPVIIYLDEDCTETQMELARIPRVGEDVVFTDTYEGHLDGVHAVLRISTQYDADGQIDHVWINVEEK